MVFPFSGMRSFSFLLTAVVIGLGGGVVAFRALAPSAWTAAVDQVETARTQWARSASPFDAPTDAAPLALKRSDGLTVGRAVARGSDWAVLSAGGEPVELRVDAAGRSFAAYAGEGAAPLALDANRPATGAGPVAAQAAEPDEGTVLAHAAMPGQTVQGRRTLPASANAMLPADAKGQPARTQLEVSKLGPQDLSLSFFPGSRLQPGQSLRSTDPRSTITSVTLSAHAPLSEVAAFYRSQFSSSGGGGQFREHRAGPGELAFSDTGHPEGDRRAYLFQNGDTVLITLVRTQPGTVR